MRILKQSAIVLGIEKIAQAFHFSVNGKNI
jgi:hypothetical protein